MHVIQTKRGLIHRVTAIGAVDEHIKISTGGARLKIVDYFLPRTSTEVNTKSWTVQRVSQGLRLLFGNHPRVPGTVEGECLLHYVNVSHTVEFERGRCSGA